MRIAMIEAESVFNSEASKAQKCFFASIEEFFDDVEEGIP
jgi:hypothetical protein